MATFAEIVNQVAGYIRDPSMQPVIIREVNSTCSYLSRTGKFAYDLREQVIDLEATEGNAASFLLSELPDFRSVEWIMDFDSGEYFEHVDPRRHTTCFRAYYLAGAFARLKAAKMPARVQVGYYANPAKMTPNFGHYWMLDVAPDAVAKFTAASLLDILGDEQAARSVRAEAVIAAEALKPYQSGVRA